MAATAEVGALAAYMQGNLTLKDFEWPESLRPSLATVSQDTHLIPQIDLQTLLVTAATGDAGIDRDPQKHELELLRDAVSSCGFFQVYNHGISISALETLHSYAKKFYSLPLQQKLEIAKSLGPLMEEGSQYSHGYSCGSPLDSPVKWWFEALRIPTANKINILTVAKCLWAEEVDQKAFGDALEKCSLGFIRLARQLTVKLLQDLELDAEGVLKELVDGDEASAGVKLNHYPACPQAEKTSGLAPHTDVSLVTVLWQDGVGGLQVQRGGWWINVKPRLDALVVNIGDIFQVWSNDRFKSGLHRVVVNTDESRHSIGFFYNPSSMSTLAPLPQLLKVAAEAPKFRSMLTSEYRRNVFKRLFQGKIEGADYLRC